MAGEGEDLARRRVLPQLLVANALVESLARQWRGLLDKLVQRIRPRDAVPDRCAAVYLIAGAIDGLGIQAVLEPTSFTPARLRRAASAIVGSAL
jgi:hypothetical protein